MKQLTIALLFIFCSLDVWGQWNLRYTSFLGSAGQVFFVKPHTIPNKEKKAEFEYDMTYVEGNDSLVLNFSVVSAMPVKVERLLIVNDNGLLVSSAPCVKLYVDMQKKKYLIRVQTWFSYDEVKEAITSPSQYCFVAKTNSGDMFFADKSSVWKKERKNLTEIFNLININNNN